ARARGDLGSDEAGADHGDAGAGLETGANCQAVVERAQHVHSLERGSAGQAPRRRAGRDDQRVVGEPLAPRDLDLPAVEVEGRGPGPKSQVQVELGKAIARVAQVGGIGAGVAGEQALRERRPVVGGMRLRAQQRQAPGVSVTAERLDRPQAGERCSDDDDAVERRAQLSWSVMARRGQEITACST
ncbi:MAG: hypothetical protein QOK00_3002, partial [Thermoleophilaceae bacterium]|nr:hypothetical protein [Thermoleophilaceae bacterium]